MGSRRNMSSHSSARRHRARLSTSRAMGPTESCTVGQGGAEREITQPQGALGLGPSKSWAVVLAEAGAEVDQANPPPPGHRRNRRPHLLPVHRQSPSDHSCWIRNTRRWKREMATLCPTPHPHSSSELPPLWKLGNQGLWCCDTTSQPKPRKGIPAWSPERWGGGARPRSHSKGLGRSLHPPPTPYLMRFPVGLMPQMPQKAEGKRMLPPMSVPKPSGEPPAAMRAPSPPEEPPGLLDDIHGFVVWPKRGLLQS